MEFATFILTEEIECLFDELDLFLELFDGESLQGQDQPQSLRNQRLKRNMYIDPKTNSTWRPVDKFRQFKAIVSHEVKVNGTPLNKIWGTFSDVSKFGQRTKINNSKSTPVGIFAYPAKHLMKTGLDLAFSSRPFLYIFKTKNPHFEAGLPGNDSDTKSFKNYEKLINQYPDLKKKHSSSMSPEYQKFSLQITDLLNHYTELVTDWEKSDLDKYRLSQGIQLRLIQMKDEVRSAAYGMKYHSPLPPNAAKIIAEKVSWLDDPEELAMEADESDIIESIKNTMSEHEVKVYFYDDNENYVREYTNMYEEVGDDLSAQFSEKYRKHLDSESESEVSILDKTFPNDSRFTFDQLFYLDKERLFEDNDDVKNLNMLQGWNTPELQKIVLEFAAKTKELVDSIYLPDQSQPAANYDKLPYYKKLKQYADDRGLSIDDAIQSATHGTGDYGNGVSLNPAKTANQFLYRTTQNLAHQLSKKTEIKSDWRILWSRILRDMGITSVADTHHSQAVHTAEPTQGVFMEPSDITLVGVIHLVAHSDKNDPANRPGKNNWSYGDGQHHRIIRQANQRVGTSVEDSLKDKEGPHRLFLGLFQRARELAERIGYSSSIHKNNFQDVDQVATNLIKIAKAVLRLQNTGRDSYRYPMLNKFNNLMSDAAASFDKMIRGAIPAHYPPSQQGNIDILNKSLAGLKQKVEVLRQLTAGQSVKTPFYRSVNVPPPLPNVDGTKEKNW